MKPYSIDLRTKIIEARNKLDESTRQLAERFQVSYSFVNRLIRRYDAKNSIEPLPHGGGKPPLIDSQQLNFVKKLVEEDNDATLQELSERLKKETGIEVSIPTMCRLVQKLKLTRKKHFMLMKLTQIGFKI
jgi:transposase